MSSGRFSVIDCSRDAYAEDVVIQKVIYYISLFNNEIYKWVKGGDSDQDRDELEEALDQAAEEDNQENEMSVE